ncbi:glycosyltransferase [Curtobacterium pusillum]|uniref:glycosyltransferase family protein n=1 Tax=Curtobacterium pusillum TaxID=69373 RepID=UPI0011A7E2DD|nr:glycosyltransferase [Curtobacterium pusillum]
MRMPAFRPRGHHTSITVVLTTRSDRHAEVASVLRAARSAFTDAADVRVESYVADGSPRGPFDEDLPWGHRDDADGVVQAIARGVARGVGPAVVVVDSSVAIEADALVALVGLVRARPGAVVQPVVRTPSGAVLSAGALLLRPGALPWSDDRAQADVHGVFAADQPVLCFSGEVSAAVAECAGAPVVRDERVAICVLSRALGDALVADVGTVTRAASPGRLVDATVVDTVNAWRDLPADPAAVGGVDPGLPLPPWGLRPVVLHRPTALRWAVKIAAPAGEEGDGWGDVHFAAELASALERTGQRVRVDRRDAHVRFDDADDDVLLSLRGLDRIVPNPTAVNLLWVISHPDLVTDTELRAFDAVFAAGSHWARSASARAGVPVRTLLQATDPSVFHPRHSAEGTDAGRVVFVGSPRGGVRPIVADAIRLGADLRLHGPGWRALAPGVAVGRPSLGRAEVAESYAAARVVLNDHWPDMAAGGFVSNRVFDVLGAGGVVVTDPVVGLTEVLDVPTLAVASSYEDLEVLLDPRHPWPSASERAAIAARIATDHSFDQRSHQLLAVAMDERARLPR